MFPANNLEKYFSELNTQSWTIIPVDLISATQLQKTAESRLKSNQFKTARISRSEHPDPEIRKDLIFWLDAKLDTLETIEKEALLELGRLTEALRNYFRISLSEFECHYSTYYTGDFYKKHVDSTNKNNKRIFSFVIYLNHLWAPADGGELVGYNNEKIVFTIKPEAGHMVLFKSELEHEVLTTNKTRFSLTGWVRT